MPEDIENADFGAKERSGYYTTTAGVVHVKAFHSRHDWAHLAAQGSSLFLAIDCGGQFVTRSHRTALTESQVGSCATRHCYTLIHCGRPEGDSQVVKAMMTVLVVTENSAKLLW